MAGRYRLGRCGVPPNIPAPPAENDEPHLELPDPTSAQLPAAGDDVIETGRSTGAVRANGAPLDVHECHIWTIRDGTIHAARFYIDSKSVLAALAIDPSIPAPQ
jgi:ketosteroid isomerase-like protein